MGTLSVTVGKLFESMSVEGNIEPEEVTMIAARSACSQKGDLRLGKSFHEYVKLEMQITMNVKCGCLDSARGIFDTMGVRDVFSWTSMVNGYAKSCELELARMSVNEMPERNVVSWSAMGLLGNHPKEALEWFVTCWRLRLFHWRTLVRVLSACGQLDCLEFGQ